MQFYSQIGQDQWVNSILNGKKDGYFIELGACDGLIYSNTLYFEKYLNWNGICIEPNNNYYNDLNKNRKCHISHDLVFSHENIEVDFSLCDAVSGIIDENIGPFTQKKEVIKKKTTTLTKILNEFNAPNIIDYLSLDVEGQEYNILKTFNFEKYKFRCITVEHNAPHVGPQQQMLIRNLLESEGYKFIKGNDDILNWKHDSIDDFYVFPELI